MLSPEMPNLMEEQRFIDLKKKLEVNRKLAFEKMETEKKNKKSLKKSTQSLNFKIKLNVGSKNKKDQSESIGSKDKNIDSVSDNIPRLLENQSNEQVDEAENKAPICDTIVLPNKVKIKKTSKKLNNQIVNSPQVKNRKTKKNTIEVSTKRVQKYRAKMTEEQLEEKRRKDRERYEKKKHAGTVKSIETLSDREKRKQRKRWKEASLKYRNNKKIQLATQHFMESNSPPNSEDEQLEENRPGKKTENVVEVNRKVENSQQAANENEIDENHNMPFETPGTSQTQNSSKKQAGRKKVKRDRATCYRKLEESKREIAELKRRLENYRKREERQRLKIIELKSQKRKSGNQSMDSPNTKIHQMTKGLDVPQEVKKQLLFGEVVRSQLSHNVQSLDNQKNKQIASKLISGKILKKYRMIGQVKNIVSYKMHKKQINSLHLSKNDRQERNSHTAQKIRKSVQEFLEKDSSSKMCPGKRDYIRKGKIIKQKRLLLDSVKNLHTKYIETGGIKISHSTFQKYKPFWIVRPTQRDRETCACIRHENIAFIVSRMHLENLINAKCPRKLINELVCDMTNVDCMFRRCLTCKLNVCYLKDESKHLLSEEIRYYQWENKTEERDIKGTKKQIKRTVKTEKYSTVKTLLEVLNKQLVEFMKHVFIMEHQMEELQNKKETLTMDEVIIQVDFSENYVAKYSSEIQSMHFGASKKQISLHTGIYYFRKDGTSVLKSQCFCSVSDTLDHQSHAIWAHLHKLLLDLATQRPNTSGIHFFSDGPTSQYRNRFNCHFFITKVPTYFKNVQEISWNFTASGHGKGPMDGVGGTLKRKADSLVLYGHDISSATTFIDKVSPNSCIKIWEVTSDEIQKCKLDMAESFASVPQIMSLHQITWSKEKPAVAFLREISCFSCPLGGICSHFSVVRTPMVTLVQQKHKTTKVNLEPNKTIRNIATRKTKVNLITGKENVCSLSPEATSLVSLEPEQQDSVGLCPRNLESVREKSEFSESEKKIHILSEVVIVPPQEQIDSLPPHDFQVKNSEAVINITSDIAVVAPQEFPQNNKVQNGLCFTCTFQISSRTVGIKCLQCQRSYHIKCILKHNLNKNGNVFVCPSCLVKKSD